MQACNGVQKMVPILTISFIEIDDDLVKRFLNAAHCGDVSSLIELLDAGMPVNSPSPSNNTKSICNLNIFKFISTLCCSTQQKATLQCAPRVKELSQLNSTWKGELLFEKPWRSNSVLQKHHQRDPKRSVKIRNTSRKCCKGRITVAKCRSGQFECYK